MTNAALQNRRRQISVCLRYLILPVGLSLFLGFLYFNRIQNLLFNGAYIDLGTWTHLAYGPTSLSHDVSSYYPSLLAYFQNHLRPIFFLLSAPSTVLPINIIDNISLIFAAEAMLITLSAAAAVLALRLPLRPLLAGLLAAVMGLAFYSSAPNLSALGYPHLEPLFAVGTVFFLLAYANRRPVWAALALVVLLSVREDMGLHFGLFVLVFASYTVVFDQVPSRRLSFLVTAGVIALCYSAIARLIQLHFFPGGHVLVGDYLGDPLYAHVTRDFLFSRLADFWDRRSYILLAFLLTIGLAAYFKRPAYLLGYVIYAPWLAFNLLALKTEAGTLSTYRMYPFALALIWPVVYEALWVNCFGRARLAAKEQNKSETAMTWGADARRRLSVVLATILICGVTMLVAAPSMAPVRNVKFAKSSQRDATLLLMAFLKEGGHHRFDLKVSRSVAAVGSTEIKAGDVVRRKIDASQGAAANGVLFHATARDACHTLKFATRSGFDRIIRLGKSNIFVAFPSSKGQGLLSALDEVNVKKLLLQEAQFPYWIADKVQRCFNKDV